MHVYSHLVFIQKRQRCKRLTSCKVSCDLSSTDKISCYLVMFILQFFSQLLGFCYQGRLCKSIPISVRDRSKAGWNMNAGVGCLAFTNKVLLYCRAFECHLVTHNKMLCAQKIHPKYENNQLPRKITTPAQAHPHPFIPPETDINLWFKVWYYAKVEATAMESVSTTRALSYLHFGKLAP